MGAQGGGSAVLSKQGTEVLPCLGAAFPFRELEVLWKLTSRHLNSSVRNDPQILKSVCVCVYINTMYFDQGIRKHYAFNYRSCGTGMWETWEENIILLICVFHC